MAGTVFQGADSAGIRISPAYCANEDDSQFLSDESGATAIEYGLIAAGISLAIIAVINGLGTKLNTKFTSINTSLK